MQWLPLSRHSAQTSPGTTRFFLSIHPLHLPYMIPCSYRASACKAVLPSCMAFYVISVRQTGDLPVVSLFPHPASFRFHLAMDTLTFGYILPTTGRIRDLHPLETCAAGRTFIKAMGIPDAPGSVMAVLLLLIIFQAHTQKTECQYGRISPGGPFPRSARFCGTVLSVHP